MLNSEAGKITEFGHYLWAKVQGERDERSDTDEDGQADSG